MVNSLLSGELSDTNYGELAFPARLAIDSNDILYVTEPDNGRVQMFNTAGQSGWQFSGWNRC